MAETARPYDNVKSSPKNATKIPLSPDIILTAVGPDVTTRLRQICKFLPRISSESLGGVIAEERLNDFSLQLRIHQGEVAQTSAGDLFVYGRLPDPKGDNDRLLQIFRARRENPSGHGETINTIDIRGIVRITNAKSGEVIWPKSEKE